MNLSYNRRIYTDPHVIADNGNAFSYTTILLAYSNTLMQINIFSEYCLGIDRNAICMPKIQSRTNISFNR